MGESFYEVKFPLLWVFQGKRFKNYSYCEILIPVYYPVIEAVLTVSPQRLEGKMSMLEKMMRIIWIDSNGNRIDITKSQTGVEIRRAANDFLSTEGDDPEGFADRLLPDSVTGEPGDLTGLAFADNVRIVREWTQIEIEEVEDPGNWIAA